ncbi:MAG: redoxin domain-containing protein [Anaerolineae bacterium]|nr:redoxin domain-containing protein [Anaerolineae bacterium]
MRQHKQRRQRRQRARLPAAAVIVFAALAGLILVACGSDAKDGTGGTGDPAPTSTIQAVVPPVINHTDQSRFDLGDPAPAFALPTSDGQTVALADYAGQPVLLFFHMAAG